MITEERLAEIEARAAAATVGPWVRQVDESRLSGSVHYTVTAPEHDGSCPCGAKHPRGALVAWLAGGLGERIEHPRTDPESLANAEFLAAARVDVPLLLAEVRRLRADRTEEARSRRVLARIGCICEPCIEAGPDGEDCWSCALKSEMRWLRASEERLAAVLEQAMEDTERYPMSMTIRERAEDVLAARKPPGDAR